MISQGGLSCQEETEKKCHTQNQSENWFRGVTLFGGAMTGLHRRKVMGYGIVPRGTIGRNTPEKRGLKTFVVRLKQG